LYPVDPAWPGNAAAVVALTASHRSRERVPRMWRVGLSGPEAVMLENDEDRIVETTTEARAGVTGQNVRTVLMASLVGAILLMILIAAVTFR
jgi:hypothetical protein